jgi:hypothetical protein
VHGRATYTLPQVAHDPHSREPLHPTTAPRAPGHDRATNRLPHATRDPHSQEPLDTTTAPHERHGMTRRPTPSDQPAGLNGSTELHMPIKPAMAEPATARSPRPAQPRPCTPHDATRAPRHDRATNGLPHVTRDPHSREPLDTTTTPHECHGVTRRTGCTRRGRPPVAAAALRECRGCVNRRRRAAMARRQTRPEPAVMQPRPSQFRRPSGCSRLGGLGTPGRRGVRTRL